MAEVMQYHEDEYHIAKNLQHPNHVMPNVTSSIHSVLDVGCGGGQTLAALCEQYSQISRAVGFDVDDAAINWGQKRWPLLRLYVSTGEAMNSEHNDTYDLVICRVALPYMDIPRALDEMVRVLKPSGHLWIVIHTYQFVLHHLREALLRRDLKHVLFMSYVFLNGICFALTGFLWRFPYRNKLESFQTASCMTRLLSKRGIGLIKCEDRKLCAVLTGQKL